MMIEVWFDGCCEPVNPGGDAGYGAAIYDDGELLHEISGFLPASRRTSNNVAEYLAFKAALEWLESQGMAEKAIHFRGDSRLVIHQMFGGPRGRKWQIRRGFYVGHARDCQRILSRFLHCSGGWIPKDQNRLADRLSKAELRRRGVEFRLQPGG